MSFTDLFENGAHKRNLGHFASMASMACADGKLKPEEEAKLKRLARKLNITESEYQEVLQNPTKYPINPPNSADRRLERMHDLFEMIFADNQIDPDEEVLLERYAIGLGYTEESASKLIKKSIAIYQGGFHLEDYKYLLNRTDR